jgi:hypothetical protein
MDLERTVAQRDKQFGQILEKVADQQYRLDDAFVGLAEAQRGVNFSQELSGIAS